MCLNPLKRAMSSPQLTTPSSTPSVERVENSESSEKGQSSKSISRSQSTSGLLDPSGDGTRMVQQIRQQSSRSIAQQANRVPPPKALQLHLHHSPVQSLEEGLQRHQQLMNLSEGLQGIEKSLRNTFFKSRSQRSQLMQEAMTQVSQNVHRLDDQDGLMEYLKAASPKEIKDQLARAVGAMRPGKYGQDAVYSMLSQNKKTLVDSMYKALMMQTIDVSGDLEIPQGTDTTVTSPGTRGIATQDFEVFDGGQMRTIKKGEPVIVHIRDGQTLIQRMTRKDNVKEGALGSWNFHSHQIAIDNPELVKVKPLRYEAVPPDQPLFEGPPSPSDVRQGALGDCFLIAPIYDLVRRDPQSIQDMMKDNGDGTVTVRLFKQNANRLEPDYITVEKSVPDNDAHAEDTLWVQMIEKAYAVQQGSYESITYGGQSAEVYKALLGVETERRDIQGGLNTIGDVLKKRVGFFENLPSVLQRVSEQAEKFGLSEVQIQSLARIPSGDLATLFSPTEISLNKLEQLSGVEWPQFRGPVERLAQAQEEGSEQGIQEAKTELADLKSLQRDFDDLITYRDKTALETLLQKSPSYKSLQHEAFLKQDQVELVLNELEQVENPIELNGESYELPSLLADLRALLQRGEFAQVETMEISGVEMHYSEKLNTLFESIEQDLADGRYLSLGSKEKIGVSTGQGASGGEDQVEGLAGQHAYAVLDTVSMNGRKFVRIANPWGNDFSRDYSLDNGKLVPHQRKQEQIHDQDSYNSGGQHIAMNESWIELHELANLFSSYHVTTSER